VRYDATSPYNSVSALRLPERIVVYDSTLRDGEQMPGIRFTKEQKIEIARMLDEIRVPQIEAGFAAVSEEERKAIKAVAELGLDAEVLSLARTLPSDLDAAIDCDVDMVLLFVATSELHMRYKLKMGKEDVISKAITALDYAKAHGLKASMSTEDSTRSDLGFMLEVLCESEKAGAVRLGITDTLGCASPEAVGFITRSLREKTSVPISAHLHNDFGLAIANSFAALGNGATAIATTVGGIGERAGNVPLEQFVMAVKHIHKRDMGIRTEGFTDLAKYVFESAKLPVPPNQPWVGANAFSHESGIHVAAVLNCPMTYECIDPEEVGNRRRLVLGKHSGTAIVRSRLQERGVSATQEQVCDIVRAIKKAGEEHGRVSDEEFWRMAREILEKSEPNPDCK